jgi:hypothetical protein
MLEHRALSYAVALCFLVSTCQAFVSNGIFLLNPALRIPGMQGCIRLPGLSNMRGRTLGSNSLRKPEEYAFSSVIHQLYKLKPLLLSPSRQAYGRSNEDEDEDSQYLMDPSSPEVRVLNARLRGEFHMPSWGRTFRPRKRKASDVTLLIPAAGGENDADHNITLREYRANFLPKQYLEACFNMTKVNMEEMYNRSSWKWSDAKKLKSLQHESARLIVATRKMDVSGHGSEVVGFVHYRYVPSCTASTFCMRIQMLPSQTPRSVTHLKHFMLTKQAT